AAIWGMSQRDDGGYFTSASHQLSTPSYALVSETVNVDTDTPDFVFHDHFAGIRIQATSSKPVFVGIGPTADVTHYLAGVQHDRIDSLDVQPFSVSYAHQAGTEQPSAPAD